MKTKTLILAMVIMMSTVALSSGKDRPDITVVSVKGSEVFKVIYKGATSGKVKLSIFDREGKTVLSENIQGREGFICPLNFRGLPSGSYTIEIVDDQGSFQQNILYVPASDLKSIHATRIDGGNRMLLAIANAQNEEIAIRIYDEEQRLIHAETKTLDGDFAQVYNVMADGQKFVFEVSDEAGNRKSFSF